MDLTITAGNASGVNDGAAAMIVASETAASAHSLMSWQDNFSDSFKLKPYGDHFGKFILDTLQMIHALTASIYPKIG